jgi:hypothetical protein
MWQWQALLTQWPRPEQAEGQLLVLQAAVKPVRSKPISVQNCTSITGPELVTGGGIVMPYA